MEHNKTTNRDRWKEDKNVILDTESGVKINRKELLLGYASKFLTLTLFPSRVWSYAVNATKWNRMLIQFLFIVRLWTKKEAEWNEMENWQKQKEAAQAKLITCNCHCCSFIHVTMCSITFS